MFLRGGPYDGEKVDGRRARGVQLIIDGGKTAEDELAEYRRSADGRYFEFVGVSKIRRYRPRATPR
jgi:hypothetical protein